MKRSEAHEGQRVRASIDGALRSGRITQVGDRRYPGLRHAARVDFDERDVIATWVPVEDLEEVKRGE